MSQVVMFDAPSDRGAIFDPKRIYRYRLWRRWSRGPGVCWIMLNPSTADDRVLDPTLRRCVDYAARWGYPAMEVVNVYAYRSTHPKFLWKVPDPVGLDNLRHIEHTILDCDLVMVGWGGNAKPKDVDAVVGVLSRLRVQPHCLHTNEDGQPTHPLYLPKTSMPLPWPRPGQLDAIYQRLSPKE